MGWQYNKYGFCFRSGCCTGQVVLIARLFNYYKSVHKGVIDRRNGPRNEKIITQVSQPVEYSCSSEYPSIYEYLELDDIPNVLWDLRNLLIILLARLGFNTKEMANATGVSSETIRSVISRMRKKFNLDTDIRSIANEI